MKAKNKSDWEYIGNTVFTYVFAAAAAFGLLGAIMGHPHQLLTFIVGGIMAITAFASNNNNKKH